MDELAYEAQVQAELVLWRDAIRRESGLIGRAAKSVQTRINKLIPEKVHAAITAGIEHMTRAILTGAGIGGLQVRGSGSLAERDEAARARIKAYRVTAAAEGGIAGAGGFLLAAADFPVLMGIKIKLLFDLAAIYGRDPSDFRERLFILSIFQLAFSSPGRRREVLADINGWDARADQLPTSMHGFEWREFQQEYRDHIDLAKMAQMLPVVGAPVGAVVNYRLLDRLGETAINTYRQRWLEGVAAPLV